MPAWKTSPLTQEEVKTIIAKLKSNASDEIVYWEIYEIFHTVKRVGGQAVMTVDRYTCTMDYREDNFDLYSLYDADLDTNVDSLSREQFLTLMNKQVEVK